MSFHRLDSFCCPDADISGQFWTQPQRQKRWLVKGLLSHPSQKREGWGTRACGVGFGLGALSSRLRF
jgi:hypothetical protein